MMHPKRIQSTLVVLSVIVVLGIGITLGRGWNNNVSAETETFEDLRVFSEALSMLQKDYVEPVKSKDLIYGAIKGMLNTLDAHSAFMPPHIYKEVQVDTKGEFGGLGLQVGIKENRLVVIAPIEETPAYKAGIKAGDWIIKVDDTITKEMNLMDAVNKMRGPKGSKVILTVAREGEDEPLSFTIVRDTIRIQSVKSKIIESEIGYIRIAQFQEKTAKDVAKAFKKFKKSEIRSLILDLRNNPGGLLASAVEVSEQFIEKGKLIVSIKGRGGKKDEYFANANETTIDLPMIILVNEGSASASEIVAGALQDLGRALILGTRTFGKGSVQTILPLTDGSAIRLTTAKYYTPKGDSIQNTGIDPDIEVKRILAKEARGFPIIREKDLARHLESENQAQKTEAEDKEPTDKEKERTRELTSAIGSEEEDVQLNKAIDLLKSWKIFKGLLPNESLEQGRGSAL